MRWPMRHYASLVWQGLNDQLFSPGGEQQDEDEGLSDGAIAGIVIGSLVFLLLIAMILMGLYWLVMRQRSAKAPVVQEQQQQQQFQLVSYDGNWIGYGPTPDLTVRISWPPYNSKATKIIILGPISLNCIFCDDHYTVR